MAAEKLRDLSQPIDVVVLDATVAAFYGTGSKEEVSFVQFSATYLFVTISLPQIHFFQPDHLRLICELRRSPPSHGHLVFFSDAFIPVILYSVRTLATESGYLVSHQNPKLGSELKGKPSDRFPTPKETALKGRKAMEKHYGKLALYYDLRLKDLVKEVQTTPFGGERFEALLDDLDKLEKEREEAYELPPQPIEELEAEEEPEKEELYQLNERKKKEKAFLQQRMKKELEHIKQRETQKKDKWLTARKKYKCVKNVGQFWRYDEEAIKRALEYWREEFGVGEYKWKQTLVADLSKVDEYLLFWLRNDQPDDLAGFIVYLDQLFVYYYVHGHNAPGSYLCDVAELIALFESRFPDVFHYVYHYLFSSQQFMKRYDDSVYTGADEKYRVDWEIQEWHFG